MTLVCPQCRLCGEKDSEDIPRHEQHHDYIRFDERRVRLRRCFPVQVRILEMEIQVRDTEGKGESPPTSSALASTHHVRSHSRLEHTLYRSDPVSIKSELLCWFEEIGQWIVLWFKVSALYLLQYQNYPSIIHHLPYYWLLTLLPLVVAVVAACYVCWFCLW